MKVLEKTLNKNEPYMWLGDSSDVHTEYLDALDVQVGGGHYKDYVIQPVEFAMSNKLDLCQANVVKYICRFRDKGGREDLKKARHYIDLLMHFEYGDKLDGDGSSS